MFFLVSSQDGRRGLERGLTVFLGHELLKHMMVSESLGIIGNARIWTSASRPKQPPAFGGLLSLDWNRWSSAIGPRQHWAHVLCVVSTLETLLGEELWRKRCAESLIFETRLPHPSPISTTYLPEGLGKFTFLL